jgi:hypothetical protein
MKTPTSLHADHQLDPLAGQFEHWRQSRSPPSARMPHHLWDQAAVLAQVLPRSRVAQHWRWSPRDLTQPMAKRPEATPAAPRTPPPFVEVPIGPACSPAPPTLESERDRPEGARLRLRCAASAGPVADWGQTFWEGAR